MELDKAIKSRYSCKRFNDKKPDWRDIIECVDACRYAPMAGNIFSLKLIIVDDKNKIEKLAQAAQQEFISRVHYVVVVCSDPTMTIDAYGPRGERYCRQQAGAAIQNFLLKITEKGLNTCWVGHFVDEQVRDALTIPKNCLIEAILPIGYEFSPSKKRRKIELDNILYFNRYKNKKMKRPKKVDT